MRIVLLLPAPLGPSSPTISPRATVKEMPDSAVRLPYRLVRLATSIIALWFMDAALASLAGGGYGTKRKERRQLGRGDSCLGLNYQLPITNYQLPMLLFLMMLRAEMI